jgi:hypothetical protein
MSALHGAAQLIEHGIGKAADFVDTTPQGLSSQITGQPARAGWNQALQGTIASDDAALAQRERDYQSQTLDSAASYAGAAVGEVAPWLTGAGEAGGLSKLSGFGEKLAAALNGGKVTQRVVGGLTQGAAVGASAPVTDNGDYWTEKGVQAGTGAGLARPAAALVRPTLHCARTRRPRQQTS